MKKLLMIAILTLLTLGCTPNKQEKLAPEKNSPEVVQSGILECPECYGDGKIDIEKESIHCPRCDGFGYLNEKEPGVFEEYSKEFIRGFNDQKAGKSYDKPAYLLKSRAKKWRAGWIEAKKLSE